MTTNDFTTDASDRALSIAMETFKPGFDPENHPSVYRLLVDMAEWARDHLAAQEPTEAEVVAVLDVKYGGPVGPHDEPYDAEEMAEARAALTAAREARP